MSRMAFQGRPYEEIQWAKILKPSKTDELVPILPTKGGIKNPQRRCRDWWELSLWRDALVGATVSFFLLLCSFPMWLAWCRWALNLSLSTNLANIIHPALPFLLRSNQPCPIHLSWSESLPSSSRTTTRSDQPQFPSKVFPSGSKPCKSSSWPWLTSQSSPSNPKPSISLD